MCFNNIFIHTVGSRFFSSRKGAKTNQLGESLKTKKKSWDWKEVRPSNQSARDLISAPNKNSFPNGLLIQEWKMWFFMSVFPPCYGIVRRDEGKDELLIAFCSYCLGSCFSITFGHWLWSFSSRRFMNFWWFRLNDLNLEMHAIFCETWWKFFSKWEMIFEVEIVSDRVSGMFWPCFS